MSAPEEVLGTYAGKEVVQSELIEKEWAEKAFLHAEVYTNLLEAMEDHGKLKLSKHDDELHERFLRDFPNINLSKLNEQVDFKSDAAKETWRALIKDFEHVKDFNFGTLLRVDPKGEYAPDNTILVVRLQFLCIEIARNRLGLNKVHYGS